MHIGMYKKSETWVHSVTVNWCEFSIWHVRNCYDWTVGQIINEDKARKRTHQQTVNIHLMHCECSSRLLTCDYHA